MRRTLLYLLVVMLVVVVVGPTQAATLQRQDDTLRIAQFVDSGASLDDGGYNGSTRLALEIVAERYDAEIEVKQAVDPDDRVADLTELAESGVDIIVTVGFNLGEVTVQLAQEYPDVHFIGVDQFQAETYDNVTGLIFPEDQSGFLAGVLAAGLTETGVVAGVYGTNEVPPVVAFREGYEAGVAWAAEHLDREIEVVGTYHPGTVFDAFSDPDWGATTASLAIDEEGADVVFAAAGGTGLGALEETAYFAGVSDGPIYCIGVDTDQWLTVEAAHACLVSSATKLITEGVVELVDSYVEGDIQGGNYLGGVGLAPFHDFDDVVDDEVRNLISLAEIGLRTGAVQTCYNLDLSELSIGLVTDVGQIDDGSFNEGAWNGLLAVEQCGAQIDFIETQDSTDYADNIAEFAENDYDIIVTVGFALGEATIEAAAAYPDVRFIGVDQFQGEVTEGVTGLIFHEDQAGFLAGALAANLTETDTIAAVLGTDQVPPVVAFNEGFEAGALYVNPELTIISTYHPGGLDVAFTDPQWGAATARQALDQGADVVFAAGGKTGNGGLIEVAAAAADGNPPYCIGVDSDQWLTVPEAHPCLVSSAMKIIDGGIATLVVQSVNDTIQDGNYFGLVGLAPFHDFESALPADLKAELEQMSVDLADGAIETGYGS